MKTVVVVTVIVGTLAGRGAAQPSNRVEDESEPAVVSSVEPGASWTDDDRKKRDKLRRTPLRRSTAVADDVCGDAADEALFSATSWSDLSNWYSRYPECDDGYFAEYVSSLVGEWLASSPKQLVSLARAVEDAPAFEDHVARHIDMTLGATTTRRIRRNVERECPSSATQICLRLLRELDDLKREATRIRLSKE